MKKKLLTLLLINLSFLSFSQNNLNSILLEKNKISKGNTKGETALNFGKSFLGKPYVAKTLEKTPEQLVCNLNQLDCYTFVESVVALTNCKYAGSFSANSFQNEILKMRYRNGRVEGYGSRMHYFTEWIQKEEELGLIKNMTKIWGKGSQRNLNFMTKHPQYYAQMSDNQTFGQIYQMEKNVSKSLFYEIPKSEFKLVENKILNGDIIVFTTTVEGLDVNHEGFAIWQNGKLHLLHASLDYKKVIISPETIEEYLKSIKKHAGIMVLRLQ